MYVQYPQTSAMRDILSSRGEWLSSYGFECSLARDLLLKTILNRGEPVSASLLRSGNICLSFLVMD